MIKKEKWSPKGEIRRKPSEKKGRKMKTGTKMNKYTEGVTVKGNENNEKKKKEERLKEKR